MNSATLPKGVYFKHGAYYRVKNNKWVRLGKTVDSALLKLRAIDGGKSVSEQIEEEMWESYVEATTSKLLGVGEIIENALKAPTRKSGIYFLIKDGHVVYVGQSQNIAARLGGHGLRFRDFDSYYFTHCDPEELNKMESAYIKKLSPKWNKKRPSDYHLGRSMVEKDYTQFRETI